MKTTLLAILLAGLAAPEVFAQGTAFTFQGRLNDGAAPATGNYDLRFTLQDAATAGSQIAGPLTLAPVGVTNGLFTVRLDFGSSAFNGAARWVTAAPYAVVAGNITGNLPDTQLSANVPKLNVNQTFSGNVNFTGPGSLGLGTASPLDAKLDLEGTLRLNDFDLWLRSGTDRNHGIGYRSTASGRGVDGPFVYGFNGGALGVRGPDSVSLAWDFGGNVWVSNGLDSASLNVRSGGNVGGSLGFGSSTRQMLNLWGTVYGLGVQANTFYQRSDGGFAWFQKGVHHNNANHPGAGGTNLMWLDSIGNLYANASVSVDVPNVNNGGPTPGVVFGYPSGEAIASARAPGSPNRYGIDFYASAVPRLSIANNGNVGINTRTPGGLLDVNTGNGSLQIISDLVPTIHLTGGGIPGTMRLRNTLEVFPSFDGTRAGKIDVRDTAGTPTITLHGSGVATVKVLEITGGADIAEPFQMSHPEEIPKGAVVVIDEENPGRLKMSSEPYDTRVAGIISGANGINPGLALHQQGKIEGGQNVALTGRVYALADATGGAIRPGDLLTTSGTPGHVMRVSDRQRGSGAVLGKAMTSLKQGKGLVLVLVSLQ
jgi:hypothetical protein